MASEATTTQVLARARSTLDLAHRWGYAPTLASLAGSLLGGEVPEPDLRVALRLAPDIVVLDGHAALRGHQDLIGPSRERAVRDRIRNGEARALAEAFAADLLRACPFIRCLAITGSVASGGYDDGDDIDFDLVVRDGTKYICYLEANLLGLRYAIQRRRTRRASRDRLLLLPKVVCVNVIWTESDTDPFVRQDRHLAFELLRAQPLFGAGRFAEILRRNAWIGPIFPQAYRRAFADEIVPRPGALAGLLEGIASRPRWLARVERLARSVARVLYVLVQTSRTDPEAKARAAFLRRVKFPYEVFQD
ncbi:MAG: hypothetical protein A3K59_11500 [Euryarchaeota archaeon RBG_19FT_COMBO_69_17]|nr:MAG: hypothetical protein A3K59_11500 [Euryarchaeota archaeon RBG_19FT_COMBO_69_17]